MCRAFLASSRRSSPFSRGRRPAGRLCRAACRRRQTTWIDFADGSVSFWRERFARPGVVIAHRRGPGLAAEARAAGAGTVHWDMYLRKRVGTPSDPADPALIEKRADALFDYAVSVSGCQTPLIALNELWGVVAPDAADADAPSATARTSSGSSAGSPSAVAGRRSSCRASRSRAATPRPGGGRSARCPISCSRTTRTRTSSGATVPVDGSRRLRVRYRAVRRRSFLRSASRRRGSGS